MNVKKILCFAAVFSSVLALDGAAIIQNTVKISDKGSAAPSSYPLIRRAEAITDLNVLPTEQGRVSMAMDEKNLYVTLTLDDSDILNESEKNQTQLQRGGDTVQLIFKPTNDTFFWDFSIAPNNLWSCFFYYGAGSMVSRDIIAADPVIKTTTKGTVNSGTERDTLWKAEITIPRSVFARGKYKFDKNTSWDVLIVRHNYSRFLDNKEISSFPQITKNIYNFDRAARLIFPDKSK